jgi:hypothetical protein
MDPQHCFHQQAKKLRKILISTGSGLLSDLCVIFKDKITNKQKNFLLASNLVMDPEKGKMPIKLFPSI